MKNLLFFLFVLVGATACQLNKEMPIEDLNPAEEGFDWEHSDPAAIELADSVMKAQGGRRAWDETHYLSWSIFGKRNLVWDKQRARVRIESLPDSTIYLLDLKTGKGRVQVQGVEITVPDTLGDMLKRAKSIWTNDSYRLVMPFKLKDTGVTLKYLGEDSLANGDLCNVIQLTFQNSGKTQENKYHVYVDRRDNLVKQWAYFESASQGTATSVWPFDNYKKYGSLLLSADRSDGNGPKNVRVDETLPAKIFTEF
jgi:hypothetical protein